MFSYLRKILGLHRESYRLAPLYTEMRNRILNLKPEELPPEAAGKVYALLMETGHPKAIVTLAAVADGTTSLYFSNGGGLIGMGEHEGPRAAGRRFHAAAADYLPLLLPAKEFPLPGRTETGFIVRTKEGAFRAHAPEVDLAEGRHPLSPLFAVGQKLISECRKARE